MDVPDEERCVVGWVQVATEDSTPTDRPDNSPQAVMEWQLIALTYLGGWYRLSLPRNPKDKENTGKVSPVPIPGAASKTVASGSAHGSPPKAGMSRRGSTTSTIRGYEKGKEKEREKEKEKEGRQCVLQEYRRFGRWDGWG